MTANNEAVKEVSALPLFTDLPRALILGNSEGVRRAGAVRPRLKYFTRVLPGDALYA
jgi:hypothetical protein